VLSQEDDRKIKVPLRWREKMAKLGSFGGGKTGQGERHLREDDGLQAKMDQIWIE
jgi:hypothetical protein